MTKADQPLFEKAQAFYEHCKGMSLEARRELLKDLPEELQDAYWKIQKSSFFVPKNELPHSREEILSPSGRYKLVLSQYTTEAGCWNYSQGRIFRQGEYQVIAVIQRNYGAFPYLFIEEHQNEHDYLICGEDYQGQTVIELDTGKHRDFLPKEAKQGHGFYWSNYKYISEYKVLVVDGCFRACPYEFRFYDFSNPMLGWPELGLYNAQGEHDLVEIDVRWPEFITDGSVRCFQTASSDDEKEVFNKSTKDKHTSVMKTRAIKTYRREEGKFILLSEWVSQTEQALRQKHEEERSRSEKEVADFRAHDPLYLAYAKLIKDPMLSPENFEGIGFTYEGWCPYFAVEEKRLNRRIINDKEVKVTVDLEWAINTGPIKLCIYKDGNRTEDKFFDEHSVQSIESAFAYAKALLGAYRKNS